MNKGTDSTLKVRAKSGEALRTLVAFALPGAREGCHIASVQLRMMTASEKSGRTLEAQLLAGGFTEASVTWANQPATVGSAATTSSGTGWRTWTVTEQLSGKAGVIGFVIRDSQEASGDAEQSFFGRESGKNLAELVVTFAPNVP